MPTTKKAGRQPTQSAQYTSQRQTHSSAEVHPKIKHALNAGANALRKTSGDDCRRGRRVGAFAYADKRSRGEQ